MKKKKSRDDATGAENLEERFSEGKEVLDYFDKDHAVRRLSLDVPIWAVKKLDQEASRRGITRQALLKTWIVDRLDALDEKKAR